MFTMIARGGGGGGKGKEGRYFLRGGEGGRWSGGLNSPSLSLFLSLRFLSVLFFPFLQTWGLDWCGTVVYSGNLIYLSFVLFVCFPFIY